MKVIKFTLVILLSVLIVSAGVILGFYLSKTNRAQINFHYSPITQKKYFEDFFTQAGECSNKDAKLTKGLIINHHLLAGKFIAQGLCSIATEEKITVILFSPNHFSRGQSSGISSLDNWQTPYGELAVNKDLINKLFQSGIIFVDEKPFEEEHGVYNVVPFIKKALPNSQIVPIIIKDNISDKEKNNLIKNLISNLPKNSIIIASLDFSHYLTSGRANEEDAKTLKIIQQFDYLGVKNLNADGQPNNVDSKPILEMFLNLMSKEGARSFKLLVNSNSAKLLGDLSQPETTSYIVGTFNVLK